MVQNRVTTGFSIYDILTRIIPGFVLFLSLFPISATKTGSLPEQAGFEILLIVVISFIFGEGLNLIRENFHPVPATFRRILYHETGNEDFLGILDKFRLKINLDIPKRKSIYYATEREFYYELLDLFDLPRDYDNIRDLFTLLISHVDTELSSRTQRFQTTYIFLDNMGLAIVFLVLIISFRTLSNDLSIALAFVLSFVAVVILLFLYVLFDLYGRLEYHYVDSLIIEFFVKER